MWCIPSEQDAAFVCQMEQVLDVYQQVYDPAHPAVCMDRYADALCLRRVCDNLNTHNFASLYQAFEPQEARRILSKLRIVYTPKHGSWLNMAEYG